MKHILLISQYFYPERFRVNDLAVQLIKKGFKVTVLTGIPNYPEGKFYKGYNWFRKRKEIFQGINIIRLPIFARGNNKLSLSINYLSFLIHGSLFAIFTRTKFDLVFTYGLSPIIQAIPGVIYSKKKKVKSFLYLMDLWPFSIEAVDGVKNKIVIKFILKLSNWIYKKTNTLLISSEGYEKDLVLMGIDRKKIIYWPQYHEDFYVPLNRDFILTPELNSDFFNFIFTGNLGSAQGLNHFLDFIQKFKVELQELNVKFNFMGDGKEKNRLVNYSKLNKIENLVNFISAKRTQDVPQYLSNSNAALLILGQHPHLSKVLPAKVASYVGCKIPIFCIAYEPLSAFIERNYYGLSTFEFDFDIIFFKIKFLINNYDYFKQKLLESNDLFNSETLINQLISLL